MAEKTDEQLRVNAMEFALRNKPQPYTDYSNALTAQPKTVVPIGYDLVVEADKIYQYLKTGNVPEQKQTT